MPYRNALVSRAALERFHCNCKSLGGAANLGRSRAFELGFWFYAEPENALAQRRRPVDRRQRAAKASGQSVTGHHRIPCRPVAMVIPKNVD